MKWKKNVLFLVVVLSIMSLSVLGIDTWLYYKRLELATVRPEALTGFIPFDLTDSVWTLVLAALITVVKELVELPWNGNGHPPPEVNAKLDELEKAIAAKENEHG